MTQEDKKLLLADLCARLPYGVNAEGEYEEDVDYNNPFPGIEKSIGHIDGIDHIGFDDGEVYVTIEGIPCELSYVKPYLRPLSSMTEEEKEELIKNFWGSHTAKDTFEELSWYLSKHFDINELIPKGLAVAVTEENNPYKVFT